jgi:hypothetical protein
MSGRQQRAGSITRRISAANENDAGRAKPGAEKKASPLASFKNQSVIRAFAILKSFYSPEEWVAACELSRRARIHEATVNRFMQSLMDVGAVVRDTEGRYRCVLFVMPGNPPFLGERSPKSREAETLSRRLS